MGRAVDLHSFFVYPDPAVFLNAVPDPDPGGKMNADPDPQPYLWGMCVLVWRISCPGYFYALHRRQLQVSGGYIYLSNKKNFT